MGRVGDPGVCQVAGAGAARLVVGVVVDLVVVHDLEEAAEGCGPQGEDIRTVPDETFGVSK